MKTFTLTFTEAELETIGAALDDYMAYADDEFASQDDLIGGLPVADRINSINDKITTVLTLNFIKFAVPFSIASSCSLAYSG